MKFILFNAPDGSPLAMVNDGSIIIYPTLKFTKPDCCEIRCQVGIQVVQGSLDDVVKRFEKSQ